VHRDILVVAVVSGRCGEGLAGKAQAFTGEGVTIAVLVFIRIVHLAAPGAGFVHLVVAVVVLVVADLLASRAHVRVGIVAVPAYLGGVVARGLAETLEVVGHPEPVIVEVAISLRAPGGSLLVDLPVTVVVNLVALLHRGRVNQRVAVFAVPRKLGLVGLFGQAEAAGIIFNAISVGVDIALVRLAE